MSVEELFNFKSKDFLDSVTYVLLHTHPRYALYSNDWAEYDNDDDNGHDTTDAAAAAADYDEDDGCDDDECCDEEEEEDELLAKKPKYLILETAIIMNIFWKQQFFWTSGKVALLAYPILEAGIILNIRQSGAWLGYLTGQLGLEGTEG